MINFNINLRGNTPSSNNKKLSFKNTQVCKNTEFLYASCSRDANKSIKKLEEWFDTVIIKSKGSSEKKQHTLDCLEHFAKKDVNNPNQPSILKLIQTAFENITKH